MSLFKQLWLSIAFLMSLAFVGSFVVSCLSAKSYLEEQLYRKNLDNASSLALSLSSEPRDPTLLELFINSQYDTGHYQFIRLVDGNGETIAEQVDDSEFHEAPQWLISLFPIEVEPGIAQVSSGWQQVGTLTLSSHTRFAYRQLWNNVKQLFYYFLLVSIGGGIIGSLLLKFITRPLHKAVDHAQAIGERRFITTEEPRTLEFKAVIRSMNKLSKHVKDMLAEETSKLEKWRMEMQQDKITGLLNRDPILSRLHSFLKSEDESAVGTLILIRLNDLFHLNQSEGRQTMDDLLARMGKSLLSQCESRSKGAAGRLNGSDFLVLLPGDHQPEDTGREIHTSLIRVCRETGLDNIKLLASSTLYHAGETSSTVLSRIDSVLATAADQDATHCIHVTAETPESTAIRPKDWDEILDKALSNKRFTLQLFPVKTTAEELLHWEAPLRLVQPDNSLVPAGQFMTHVNRLGVGSQLDIIVTELALKKIQQLNTSVGINLSTSVLSQPSVMGELAERIKSHSEYASLLWLEVPEYGAFQNLEGFRTLCQLLKPLNCKVGIEHVGQEVTQIGALHDLGLDFVKIDRALIHNIDTTTAYQVFIRGLCTIVHSIGLKAIAEGVDTEAEWDTLIELGIDGGTGGYFSAGPSSL